LACCLNLAGRGHSKLYASVCHAYLQEVIMANWIISYSKDNNTNTLNLEAEHKPSMEQAVLELLDWARGNLEKGEFGDGQDRRSNEPAVVLLRDYGITITGISEES